MDSEPRICSQNAADANSLVRPSRHLRPASGKANPSLKATDGAWKGMTALDVAKKASRAPVVALLESSY
jgi:hypothetical protein